MFVFIYVYLCPTRLPYQMMFVSFNSNTTGVNGVTGTAYPSRLHELTPDFYCILLCSVSRPFSVLLYFFYWLSFADCKTILSDPIHYIIFSSGGLANTPNPPSPTPLSHLIVILYPQGLLLVNLFSSWILLKYRSLKQPVGAFWHVFLWYHQTFYTLYPLFL